MYVGSQNVKRRVCRPKDQGTATTTGPLGPPAKGQHQREARHHTVTYVESIGFAGLIDEEPLNSNIKTRKTCSYDLLINI